jgi:hypothetical protein
MTRRAWYRSPVLWFGLPGFVFLCFAWYDSLSMRSELDLVTPGGEVTLIHHGGKLGISWDEGRAFGRTGKPWQLVLEPRDAKRSFEWLPLPSYLSGEGYRGSRWHNVGLSHWLVILAYAGLWQLPWLWRYYRRKWIATGLEASEEAPSEGGRSTTPPTST